mgnify:CR=1 FL=1
MANLHKRKFTIEQSEIDIRFSQSLWDSIDHKKLQRVFKGINKLPTGIPKIREVFAATDPILKNTATDKIAKVKSLFKETDQIGVFQVHIAYEPGETYSLGNTVGRVFAIPGGLILLNDQRIKQVAGERIDPTYLVNLILHELLHAYGVDHARGLPFHKVKNTPVMNIGKFGKLGLAQDDIAGLRERYNVPKRNRVTLTINTTQGDRVGLVNKDKNARSQGKNVIKGQAVFPQLHKGKYDVYIEDRKTKIVTVKKDKEITI